MRDEKAAVGTPWIHSETTFTAHLGQVAPIEDFEYQAEAVFEFALPLFKNGRWCCDHDNLRLLAQKQFASDEARLDRLTETGIIGDEEIHPRQEERLAEWLHLISVDFDAGAKRSLEEIR